MAGVGTGVGPGVKQGAEQGVGQREGSGAEPGEGTEARLVFGTVALQVTKVTELKPELN